MMCDTRGANAKIMRMAHMAITPQNAIKSVQDDRHMEPWYSLTTLVSSGNGYSSCRVSTTPHFDVTARMSKTMLLPVSLDICNPFSGTVGRSFWKKIKKEPHMRPSLE